MIAVIQRVKSAKVDIAGDTFSSINQGLLILLGVCDDDDEKTVKKVIDKAVKLRIFSDENGKMNKSVVDVEGEMLIVSQFTLMADCKKGNRPSFIKAGDPNRAKELYENAIELAKTSVPTKQGVFGADMQIQLVNDGPVTILLDSKEL